MMKPLEVNKSESLECPLFENSNKLVRTGTLQCDNSCIHALLHAYSLDYVKKDTEERHKIARHVKERLASNLSESEWEKIDNGILSRKSFQENVELILSDVYKYVKSPVSSSSNKYLNDLVKNNTILLNMEIYKLLVPTIPIELFTDSDKGILIKSYNKYCGLSENKLELYKDIIIQNTYVLLEKEFKKIDLDDDKIEYYLDKFIFLIRYILILANKSAFESFRKKLSDYSVAISPNMFKLLSDKFERDLYFINSRTCLPFNYSNNIEYKDRTSNIVLVFSNHYEILGKVIDNKIYRNFTYDDPIIKLIKSYLSNPRKYNMQLRNNEYEDNRSRRPNRLDDDNVPPRRPNRLDDDNVPPRRHNRLDDDNVPTRRHNRLDDDNVPPRRPNRLEDDNVPTRRHNRLDDDNVPTRRPNRLDDDNVPPRRSNKLDENNVPRRSNKLEDEVPTRRHDNDRLPRLEDDKVPRRPNNKLGNNDSSTEEDEEDRKYTSRRDTRKHIRIDDDVVLRRNNKVEDDSETPTQRNRRVDDDITNRRNVLDSSSEDIKLGRINNNEPPRRNKYLVKSPPLRTTNKY